MPDLFAPRAYGLYLIYARSSNHCIGNHGQLPWKLPNEYRHFENVTRGYPIIMGRRSYEDHEGLLPGSTNIIVSRQECLAIETGGILRKDLTSAIQAAQALNSRYFVIGGAGLITEAMEQAVGVFESVVEAHINGDTYLPDFDFSEWRTETLFAHSLDTEHDHPFKALLHTRGQS